MSSLQKAIQDVKSAEEEEEEKEEANVGKTVEDVANNDSPETAEVPSLQKDVQESMDSSPNPTSTPTDPDDKTPQQHVVPSLQRAVQESKAPASPPTTVATTTDSSDGSNKSHRNRRNSDHHKDMESSLHRALEDSHLHQHQHHTVPAPPSKESTTTAPSTTTTTSNAMTASSRMGGSTRYRASGGNRPRRRIGANVKELSERFTAREDDDTSLANADNFPIQATPKVRSTRKELETQVDHQLITIKELEAKNRELTLKMQQKNEQLLKARKLEDEQKKQIDSLEKEIQEKVKASVLAIEELQSELGPLREEAKAKDEMVKGLEQKLKRLQLSMEDVSVKENGLEKVIEQQEAQIDVLQKEKLEQSKKFSAEREDLKSQLREASREVDVWKSTNKKQQQRIEDLESQATPLNKKIEDLEEKLQKREGQMKNLHANVAEKEKDMEERLQKKERQVKKLQSSVDEGTIKMTNLQLTIGEQKRQIDVLQKGNDERTAASSAEVEEVKQKLLETDRKVADLRTTTFSQQQQIEKLELEGIEKDKTLEETVKRMEARNDAKRERIQDLEARNEELGDKLERTKEKVNRLQSSVDDVSTKEDSLEKTIEQREEQIDSLRTELLEQAKASEAEIGELKKKLQGANHTAADWEANYKKQQQRIEGLESECKERSEALEETVEGLKTENKTQLEKIQDLEAENARMVERLQHSKNDLKRMKSMDEREKQKVTTLEITIGEQRNQLDSLQREMKQQARDSAAGMEELKQQLLLANDEVAGWQSTNEKQKRQIRGLESEAVPLRKKADDLEESVRRLEVQNETRLGRIQHLEAEYEQLEERSERLQQSTREEVARLASNMEEEAMRGAGLDKTIEQQKEEMDALLQEVLALGDDEMSVAGKNERGHSMKGRHMARESSQDDLDSLAEELEQSKHDSLPAEIKLQQQVEEMRRDKAELETKLHNQEEALAITKAENAELEESVASQKLQIETLSRVNERQRQRLLEKDDMESNSSPGNLGRLDMKGQEKVGGSLRDSTTSRGGHRTPPPVPFDEDTPSDEEIEEMTFSVPSAPALRRCDTSELVKAHRFRRPSTLMETSESDLSKSNDNIKKDWSKPSLGGSSDSYQRYGRRSGSPPPPLTEYEDLSNNIMSPASHYLPRQLKEQGPRGRIKGGSSRFFPGEVEEELDDVGLPKDVLKRLEAVHKGGSDVDASSYSHSEVMAAQDMDASNSEVFAEQLQLAWAQQGEETEALHRGFPGRSRRREESPPPLSPYEDGFNSNISPASPRNMRRKPKDEQEGGLPRDVMKRLEAVHQDMDVSFSHSQAYSEQLEQTWLQQQQDGDDGIVRGRGMQGLHSSNARKGSPPPSRTPYKEDYISNLSPDSPKQLYHRRNGSGAEISAFGRSGGYRGYKPDESSEYTEETEGDFRDVGPFREKWRAIPKDGRSNYESSVASEETEERDGLMNLRAVGRKMEAIDNDMDASFSNSNAIAEQMELVWFQQQAEEESEGIQRGQGVESPYSLALYGGKATSRHSLRDSKTSELVRQHRLRRPTVVLETNEIESSGSDASQDRSRDYPRAEKATIAVKSLRPSEGRRQKSHHSRKWGGDMDSSFSASEAIAQQLEVAWFQQEDTEASRTGMESPYTSPHLGRKLRGGRLNVLLDNSAEDSSAEEDEGQGLSWFHQHQLRQLGEENELQSPFVNQAMLVQNPYSTEHPWRKGSNDSQAAVPLTPSDEESNEYVSRNDRHLLERDSLAPSKHSTASVEDDSSSILGKGDMEHSTVLEKQYEIIKTLQADNKELLRQLWDLEMNSEKEIEELQRELEARDARIAELQLTCDEMKEEKVVLLQTSDMLRHLLEEAEETCKRQRGLFSGEEKKLMKKSSAAGVKTNTEVVEFAAESSVNDMKEEKAVLLKSLESLSWLLTESENSGENQRSQILKLEEEKAGRVCDLETQTLLVKAIAAQLRGTIDHLKGGQKTRKQAIDELITRIAELEDICALHDTANDSPQAEKDLLNTEPKKALHAKMEGLRKRPMKTVELETIGEFTETTLATGEEATVLTGEDRSADGMESAISSPAGSDGTVGGQASSDKDDSKRELDQKTSQDLQATVTANRELSALEILQLLSFSLPDQ